MFAADFLLRGMIMDRLEFQMTVAKYWKIKFWYQAAVGFQFKDETKQHLVMTLGCRLVLVSVVLRKK